MSARDPKATLNQIRDAARRAQEICAGKNLEDLLNNWQATAALERFIETTPKCSKTWADSRERHAS